jgi:hypothetical protein
MSNKPGDQRVIFYTPAVDVDDGPDNNNLERVISDFWDSQYQLGQWIRFTRIVDWIVSRDRHGNRVLRDEMLIDEPARVAYLKLSKAVLVGFFDSQTILVSPQWPLVEGSPDDDVAARTAITIDQFRDASRSSIMDRWTVSPVEADQFIGAYLQNMAITNRACSDWLSQEGYDLPPWLTASEVGLDKIEAAPSAKSKSGIGKTERSIQVAFNLLFPSGSIPAGMSSQDRDDLIFGKLKELGFRQQPHVRTIQRALKNLN